MFQLSARVIAEKCGPQDSNCSRNDRRSNFEYFARCVCVCVCVCLSVCRHIFSMQLCHSHARCSQDILKVGSGPGDIFCSWEAKFEDECGLTPEY